MLGHYVNGLTPTQEDAVLTRPMGPHNMTTCLVGIADGYPGHYTRCVRHAHKVARLFWAGPRGLYVTWNGDFVGDHYDRLCEHFGCTRVNNAIRTRILANRARRALGPTAAAFKRGDPLMGYPNLFVKQEVY